MDSWKTRHNQCRPCLSRRCSKSGTCCRSDPGRMVRWNDGVGRGPIALPCSCLALSSWLPVLAYLVDAFGPCSPCFWLCLPCLCTGHMVADPCDLGKCCCSWCLAYFQLGKPQTLALWIILRIRLLWVRSTLLVCGTNHISFSLTCPLGTSGQFPKLTFMERMSQDSRRGFVLPRHNTDTASRMFHLCGRV